MYIFRRGFFGPAFYLLWDRQTEAPVDYCAKCGGEIYAFDPVDWDEDAPICPACVSREERERKNKKRT